MGSIHRVDRPKPWQAKDRGPDGRQHSRSFRRKVEAEAWLRSDESSTDRGEWVNPRSGDVLLAEAAETWVGGLHEVAVSKRFDQGFRDEIRRVLLKFHETKEGREVLALGGVERWVAVGPTDDDIRRMVRACEEAGFMEIR